MIQEKMFKSSIYSDTELVHFTPQYLNHEQHYGIFGVKELISQVSSDKLHIMMNLFYL